MTPLNGYQSPPPRKVSVDPGGCGCIVLGLLFAVLVVFLLVALRYGLEALFA